MTGSSDIRDSDMIDKIKIKSKEEGGGKATKKLTRRFKRTADRAH